MKWLIGNLNGIIGQRWFMAVLITVFIIMKATIITFQMQKDELRDEKTEIISQMNKNKSEHISEIKRITVKHNQIIKDMISKEELKRLQSELENQKNKTKVEKVYIDKLNQELEQVKLLNIDRCELSPEVIKILNK